MERQCRFDASGRCDVCGLTPLVHGLRRAARVIAESDAMREVLKRTARFARATAPIVILGESGTGKEVLARAIHANSPRADGPFVAVNIAALPADLLESELFGHTRGAFTGAATQKEGLFHAAAGGTLFLDEIAEMPVGLQAKLLRALQDGEVRRVGETRASAVDVRIVCATHRDLRARVAEGSFREDLLYRLKVLTLDVPPLRARREDILPLARLLLREEGRDDLRLSPAAERLLDAHSWPGNVRELQNVIKHGIALVDGPVIDVEHLPAEITEPTSCTIPPSMNAPGAADSPPPRTLAEIEREHVERVLQQCGGSQIEAARMLGIARNTLWRKLRSYQ